MYLRHTHLFSDCTSRIPLTEHYTKNRIKRHILYTEEYSADIPSCKKYLCAQKMFRGENYLDFEDHEIAFANGANNTPRYECGSRTKIITPYPNNEYLPIIENEKISVDMYIPLNYSFTEYPIRSAKSEQPETPFWSAPSITYERENIPTTNIIKNIDFTIDGYSSNILTLQQRKNNIYTVKGLIYGCHSETLKNFQEEAKYPEYIMKIINTY